MTRTLARQMSGPVPSPSMKGMIGLSGTMSLPSRMVILAPCAGGVTFIGAAVDMRISPKYCVGGAVWEGAAGPEMLAQWARRMPAGPLPWLSWPIALGSLRVRDLPALIDSHRGHRRSGPLRHP